jgi:exodeoxyribonuclease VII large subunit
MEPHLSEKADQPENPILGLEGQGSLPRFFSVAQYNRSVERLVKREVPKVWVQGTITQIQVRGRVAYLTLAEFEVDEARPKAAVDVFCWASDLEAYNARFAALATPFQLKAMLKVAFQMEAGFYVPTGRFQPRIVDIDPRFTIGELALTRQKILAALRRDGLLTRNKVLPLSAYPLRIGLITAPGSAAYQDFTTTLLASGFSFEILFSGARMQGDRTEASVIEALHRLKQYQPDCICIVRGGGSRTDLVYFDSELICRAIALSPIPVLTGIGHEIDRSLADEVAHADLITPTDCAKFLEERLQEAFGQLAHHRVSLQRSWRSCRRETTHEISGLAQKLSQSFQAAQAREVERSVALLAHLRQGVRHHLVEAQKHLQRNRIGMQRGPTKVLNAARWKLRFRGELLRSGFGKKRSIWHENLVTRQVRLLGVKAQMKSAMEKLFQWQFAIRSQWRQELRFSQESVASKSRWLRALDPEFFQRWGYVLVRNEQGLPVPSMKGLRQEETLTLTWHDGIAQVKVLQTDTKDLEN